MIKKDKTYLNITGNIQHWRTSITYEDVPINFENKYDWK